jgi:hypothetical protein
MDKPTVELANLDGAKLKKVQKLEKKLGTWVVAIEPTVRFAELSKDELKQLQAAEQELGVILLAYEAG